MATRTFFIVRDGKVLEETIEFKYYSGFAIFKKRVWFHCTMIKKVFWLVIRCDH